MANEPLGLRVKTELIYSVIQNYSDTYLVRRHLKALMYCYVFDHQSVIDTEKENAQRERDTEKANCAKPNCA